MLSCCELSGAITLEVSEQGTSRRVAKGRSKRRNPFKIMKLYVLSQLIGSMLLRSNLKDSLMQTRSASVVKINTMVQLHLHKFLESLYRFLVIGLVTVLKSVYLASRCLHFLLYLTTET